MSRRKFKNYKNMKKKKINFKVLEKDNNNSSIEDLIIPSKNMEKIKGGKACGVFCIVCLTLGLCFTLGGEKPPPTA